MTPDFHQRQNDFINACTRGGSTLAEVMADLKIEPAVLAEWMSHKPFRMRVMRVRRHLARLRDLQLAMGAYRASHALADVVVNVETGQPAPMIRERRAASIDLIRLARDANRHAAADANIDPSTRRGPLYHPDVSDEQAQALMRKLSTPEETEPGEEPV